MRASGFTLLEVLLALTLFTFIATVTVKNISQIQNTKKTAFEDIDLYNNVRAALSMMRNDLQQAFHVLYEDLGEEARQIVVQNQNVHHTMFDGRKNELVFTSLSHRNFYTERRQCEQTEISYYLNSQNKSASLLKRESEIMDDNLFQGGSIYTLMENVSLLEFSYWDDRQQKWIDQWNSDAGAERDRFPQAIQLKVTVSRGSQKVTIETQFKVAFTNNDPVLAQF